MTEQERNMRVPHVCTLGCDTLPTDHLPKQRWVEWVEPFGPNNEAVYMRVPEATAIAVSKKAAADRSHSFLYVNDEDALSDFMTVHWASFVEDNR